LAFDFLLQLCNLLLKFLCLLVERVHIVEHGEILVLCRDKSSDQLFHLRYSRSSLCKLQLRWLADRESGISARLDAFEGLLHGEWRFRDDLADLLLFVTGCTPVPFRLCMQAA
jgi:hypothetical protein